MKKLKAKLSSMQKVIFLVFALIVMSASVVLAHDDCEPDYEKLIPHAQNMALNVSQDTWCVVNRQFVPGNETTGDRIEVVICRQTNRSKQLIIVVYRHHHKFHQFGKLLNNQIIGFTYNKDPLYDQSCRLLQSEPGSYLTPYPIADR